MEHLRYHKSKSSSTELNQLVTIPGTPSTTVAGRSRGDSGRTGLEQPAKDAAVVHPVMRQFQHNGAHY